MAENKTLFSPTCNLFVSSLVWADKEHCTEVSKSEYFILYIFAQQEFQEKLLTNFKKQKTPTY